MAGTGEDSPRGQRAIGKEARKRLQAKRDHELKCIVDSATVDDYASLKKHVSRLSVYSAALEAARGRPFPTYPWFLITGAASLILVSVLWLTQISDVRASLRLTSSSISMRTAEACTLSTYVSLDSTFIRLPKLSSVLANGFGVSLADPRSSMWLNLNASDMILRRLALDADSDVSIEMISDDIAQLIVRGGKLEVAIILLGKSAVEIGIRDSTIVDTTVIADVPEEIVVCRQQNFASPLKLRIRLIEAWSLPGLAVNKLEFARVVHRDATTPTREFTLKSGAFSLIDLARSGTIDKGQRFSLDGVSGSVRRLTVTNDGIELLFEGEVSSIVLGEGKFEQELIPPLLEMLYHKYENSLFIGAIVLVWGTLWSLRRRIKL